MLLSGKAKCEWTERRTRTVGAGENRRTESYTVYHKGKEVFLNTKHYLFGHDGGKATEIAAGTYTYNFVVKLPELLPESFDGTLGSIFYKAVAVLDVPWKFDKEIEEPFTVARRDNLSDFPELKIPQCQEMIKSFFCLFCASGSCVITVTIPYGGYARVKVFPSRSSMRTKAAATSNGH